MKNIIKRALIIFFAVSLGFCGLIMPKTPHKTNASETEKTLSILSETFATTPESLLNYGINQNYVHYFTPFNQHTSERLIGASFKPELVGSEDKKHIETSFNVDNGVLSFDASTIDLTKTYLEVWVNFDSKLNLITRGIKIELSDSENLNGIYWLINIDELQTLLTREELNQYDEKIYGSTISNTPIGWVKLKLPITSGITTGELIKNDKYNFTKCSFSQTNETGSAQPLSLYGMKLISTNTTQTERTSEILSYSNIAIKQSAKVLHTNDKFYIGEAFPKFMSINDVFVSCWVGETNYLSNQNVANLKVRTDSGIGSNSQNYYSFGASDFIIRASAYSVSYGFLLDNRFVGILTDRFTASNYGKGVWIDSEEENIEIGKTKKIYFSVHEAFSYASISFESSNEEVLTIKEVNYEHKYLVVEALKKGTAEIKISITDDRLIGTEFEETGIINNDYEIEVVKVKKNTNTTKVMLWIALGLFIVGLIYLAIKAILDARKIDIK